MSKGAIICQKNVLILLFNWKSIGVSEGDVTEVLRFSEVGWDRMVLYLVHRSRIVSGT